MIKNDTISHISGIFSLVWILFWVIMFVAGGLSWWFILALPFFTFSIISFLVFVLRWIYLVGKNSWEANSKDLNNH